MSKITPNEWTILEHLAKGRCWIRSLQTVKPLLEDLIARGLVERCRPHLGRCTNMVRLTDAGCDLLEISPADVPVDKPKPVRPVKRRHELGTIREGVTQRVRSICQIYLTGMQRNESESEIIGQLAALHDVQRPAIWKALRVGGVIPEYGEQRDGGKGRPKGGGTPGYTASRRARAMEAAGVRRREPDPSQWVSRDPCPRCGVRADIGCAHSHVRLGVTL